MSLSAGRCSTPSTPGRLVYSLLGDHLTMETSIDIKMATMPDEYDFFSHASFDEVRCSHRPDASRMLSPACGHPCLPLSRSLVPSRCCVAPDTALCPSADALRLTLPYR
jgi:hypothetical protein